MDGQEIVLQVDVIVKAFDTRTGTFGEVISASGKITKADAGVVEIKEEWITISIDPGGSPNYADAKVFVSTHSKPCGNAQTPN